MTEALLMAYLGGWFIWWAYQEFEPESGFVALLWPLWGLLAFISLFTKKDDPR